jgi:hypothetical protein
MPYAGNYNTDQPLGQATETSSVADWAVANTQRWAQSHAETCRAMPRPAE